jgi:hypothetical protein
MYNLIRYTINHLLSCLYGLKAIIPIEFLNIKGNFNRTAKKITIAQITSDVCQLQHNSTDTITCLMGIWA